MSTRLPILLLDERTHRRMPDLGERWSIHAFQREEDARSGLSHLKVVAVLARLGDEGLGFARHVGLVDPSLPVIFFAEDPTPQDYAFAFEVGARDVVVTDGSLGPSVAPGLERAVAWRTALRKGVETLVREQKATADSLRKQVTALQERVVELEIQASAEASIVVQTQQQLELQRELAMAAVRSKGRFLANMSHELRTPLNAILGYAELLQESVPDAGTDSARIIESSRGLLELLHEVLNLARLESGRVHPVFEPTKVMTLASACVDAVQHPGVRLGEIDVDEVVTDPARLREAVDHLLANAIKFAPEGEITLSVRRDEPHVVFSVQDTGPGLSAVQLETIFDAFADPDASEVEGAGLGLAVASQLARVLGGRITAESTEGEGSLFEIHLPQATAANNDVAGVGQQLLVVLIDDDPVLRTLLQRMLQADGYAVIACADGTEGLRIVKESRPSLIACDVMLPGTDGYGVLAAIKGDPEISDIPIVMFSASEPPDRALAEGACAFVSKPVRREVLREVVETHALRRAAGLLVVGRAMPFGVTSVERDGIRIGRVMPTELAEALVDFEPAAVLVDANLSIAEASLALEVLGEHAPDLPVVGFAGLVPADERAYLDSHLSGLVQPGPDAVETLRDYAFQR